MKLRTSSMIAVIAVGGVLALSPLARSQDNSSARPAAKQDAASRRGNMMQRITERLSLTDDQKPKVEAALKEMRTKAAELRKDTSLTAADRQAKMKPIREELNKQMKTILTSDQYEKWQKMSQRGPRTGSKGSKAASAQN